MTNVLVAASAVTVLFAQPAEPDADWRAFFGTLHAHSGVSDGVERPNVAFSDEISDASSPPPPKWATYQPSGFGFGVQGGAVSATYQGSIIPEAVPDMFDSDPKFEIRINHDADSVSRSLIPELFGPHR